MTKKVISFLGVTDYKDTTYVFGFDRYTTCYMAEAAYHFFNPDELLVVVTKEACSKHFDPLSKQLGGKITPKRISIPSGQSEAEQWEMFTVIADQIGSDDQIIFDITNGFRSIPVIAILVAAYVQVVRQATVNHIIYGAFDARNPELNETPVFDLSPLASLLDWTTATEAFLRYGRADALSNLVSRSMPGLPVATDLSDRLGNLTAALQTSRPAEVMTTAFGLPGDLAAFRTAQPANGNQPLGLLLTRIEHEYTPIGHAQPYNKVLAQEVLIKQLEMIEWYIGKQLYVQAFTLTREWLISVVLTKGEMDLYGSDEREFAEAAINGYPSTRNGHAVPQDLRDICKHELLKQIWKSCRDLRNDLAHAGMRRNAKRAAEVEKKVREVCSQLRPLLKGMGYPV